MAGGKNNKTLFVVFIVVIISLAVFCIWNKKYASTSSETPPSSSSGGGTEQYSHSKPSVTPQKESFGLQGETSIPEDQGVMELIHDGTANEGGDEFELLGDYDANFDEGFGMGPGLYGSGRHTSEMFS